MLNYNVNYIEPYKRSRNFLVGKVDYTWARTTNVAAGTQPPIIYGSGSISFVPYSPTTIFFSSSFETGSLSSGSAIGQPIAISVTGSGVWPLTGSNQLSIVVGSALGFNQSNILTLSAAAGNMNLSGSRISSSFVPVGNDEYNITFGLAHIKGNIYNPSVNWKSQNISTVSNTVGINGYTSSFNIVKNTNESLVSKAEVTSSFSSSFDYLYNFGVTSSLSSSIQSNATGSVTMSIEIPEAGLNAVKKIFSNTNAGLNTLTGSFVATTDSPYTITASIEYNKGNESNSDINWLASASSTTQDLEGDASNINGVSSSFQLKKDIAIMATIGEITSSVSGTYPNDYSFNQTASLTSNTNNVTGSVTMSISIPEAGISVERRVFNATTTTATLTASFEAQKNVTDYNITASVINNKGNESNSDINWLATSSNNDSATWTTASFMIVKDATVKMVGVDNMLIGSASNFKNTYAFNVTASLSGSFTSSWSPYSASIRTSRFYFSIPETGFLSESISSPINWTSSFVAVTDSASYNITASCVGYTSPALLVQAASTMGNVIDSSSVLAIAGLNFNSKVTSNFTSSLTLFTSSIGNAGSFIPKTLIVSGSEIVSTFSNTIANFAQNYFPWPFIPTYNIVENEAGKNNTIAYWGKPSMYITGSASTTYISGSNITIHNLAMGTTASLSSSVVPTTGSHLLAETMTVGGGGRGGTKEFNSDIFPSGYDYVFSGGGGAGGYVLANNYFKKGITYNIVVGDGAPRWDGSSLTPTSGSDSYIYGGGATIQLSKGGGNGGPITGSGFTGPGHDVYGAGGRAGGSGGGGGYIFGQLYSELGADSITGSVSNPFETYGAFEGYSGGTAYSPFRVPNIPNAQANAGGGGGASQDGFDNLATTNTLGAGGLGKYDLSFTMQGVAGGGAGANSSANATGSFAFGGGQSQRYTVSGSISACDGVDGTGGGGGGLISASLQPYNAPFNYTTKGGKGKVQIRYASSTPLASGGTIESGSISGSLYILHTFTASGTFTPNS